MRLLLNTLFFLVLSFPVLAAEFVYSPEGCDFQITFPGEPFATRRCHDQMKDKCSLMTSYTQVFDLDATVNFYVSCTPSAKNFRKDFTPDLMRTSLLARPGIENLEVYDISYNETDNATMAALLGAGNSANGNNEILYVTQLWVGNGSVLTLEAELIGKQTEKSDRLFADILQSLRHNDDRKASSEAEEKDGANAPSEEENEQP